MRSPLFLVALSGVALLSSCGPQVNAPSLGLRPVEKQPIDLPAETSEPATPVDPALAGRITPLVAAAQAGDEAFARQRAEVEAAIAKAAGAAQGSEAWIVAQQALSTLDGARAPVRDAAAKIEALRDDPANAASGNRTAIEEAAKIVEALDDAEAAAVATLGTKLGG